ncbi:MAG: TatD family hydrolase [Spirochaetaceae bacterium]
MPRDTLPPIDIYPGTVDSHFHPAVMAGRGLEIEVLLPDLYAAGLAVALEVSISLDDAAERLARLERYPYLRGTMGFHPSQSGRLDLHQVERELPAALEAPGVVALGEIGLDWYRDYAPRQTQIDLFLLQLEIAERLGYPVIIHNREATGDLLELLKGRPPRRRGIVHCFSGTWEEARSFIDLNFVVSFAGNVTFTKSADIREAAAKAPSDAYLIETDSPFLAPVPYRGKNNHPGTLGIVARTIAEARGVPPEEVVSETGENFRRLGFVR